MPSLCRSAVASLRSSPVRRVAAPRRALQVRALWGKGDGEGKGGFGGVGNLMESMKQAQALVQGEAGRIQQELAETEFEGYDEEEYVKATFKGNQEPIRVELAEGATDCETSVLEARITEAMKDAHQKSVLAMKDKMSELAKKLGLPANADFGKL